MSKSLESVLDANFDVVKEYLHTGSSTALSEEHQRMLSVCLDTYALLKKYPQRDICIRQLRKTHNLAYNTAAKYVDFARNTWGSYIDVRREFLETFFLDRLLSAISDPNATEVGRAKNLATLQRYIESMPEQRIDPKIMEQNNVLIQVNVNGKAVKLPETTLEAMPIETRQALLSALGGEIDDDGAVQLLEG